MKKKRLNLIIATLIISLLNTGFLIYLVSDKVSFELKNRPIIISKELDRGQTYALAKETGKPVIVWFYTDWCGYCQKFAPTFKKLSKDKELTEKFAIAFVNAENPSNEEIVKEFNVDGYPSLYIVNANKKELIKPQNLFMPKAHEYLKDLFFEFIK